VLLDEGSLVTRGRTTDVLANIARGEKGAQTVRGRGEGSEQSADLAVSVAPMHERMMIRSGYYPFASLHIELTQPGNRRVLHGREAS